MSTLDSLALTPKQQAELASVEAGLLEAWLSALDSSPDVRSPVGFVLAGVRSGVAPAAADDARARSATLRAERTVRNLGATIADEAELIAILFAPAELTADIATLERVGAELTPNAEAVLGATLRAQLAHTREHGRAEVPGSGGPLRGFDSAALRTRMVALWRAQPGVGVLEPEATVEARGAVADGGTEGPGKVEHPPPPLADPDGQATLEPLVVGAPPEEPWPSREQAYPDEQGWRRWADDFDGGDG